MTESAKKPFELTGRHALFGFGAFFATLIAVQVAFITIAVSTHTGMVSKQPYRKGLNYGERIEQERAQKKLGWRETLTVSKADKTVTIAFVDQYGKPVRGLHLNGTIGRAVTDTQDSSLAFKAHGDGVYVSTMPDDLAGSYIADFNATQSAPDGKIVWRMRKRLWLKP